MSPPPAGAGRAGALTTRRRLAIAGAAVLVAAGGALVLTHLPSRPSPAAGGPSASDGTAFASVTRGTLSVQQQVTGTVAYSGSYSVANQLSGVYTKLPSTDAVIDEGQPIFSVGTGSGASESALLSAQAQLASDEASLQALVSPTPPTAEQLQAAQARVQADQAKVSADQAELQGLKVSTPIVGQISQVDVSPGQSVGEGQTLFQVVDPTSVTVQANFPSTNLQNAFVGEGAQVTVAGYGTIQATIASIGVVSSGQGRGGALYPVTLALQSPPSGLRSGMPVTVSIPNAYTYAQGTIEFSKTLDVTASASGAVASVNVTAGSAVKPGDTVVTLSSPGLSTQLAQDQSQLASDQSSLDALTHPAAPSSGQVAALKARIASDRQAVSQAQQALSQSNEPVVLLYGDTPAYRTLQEGESGPEVQELNKDLVTLGYASGSALSPASQTYSAATAAAVRKLQAHLGAPQTGILTLGDAVFLPTSLRVTSVTPSPGTPAAAGQSVLSATSGTSEVLAQIDATLQSAVKPGQDVSITLPDQSVIDGKVLSVGEVTASSSGSGSGSGTPETVVYISPDKPSALRLLDGADVNVAVTTQTVKNVLEVPITALLAQTGGGYAVEVVGTGQKRRILPVHIGLVDDATGLVQVSGAGLFQGMQVTVAGS